METMENKFKSLKYAILINTKQKRFPRTQNMIMPYSCLRKILEMIMAFLVWMQELIM